MNTSIAYQHLLNGSVFKASDAVYTEAIGIWFYPIIFMFTLVLIYIKTENPAYVFIYSIIGNVVIGIKLATVTHPIFYATAVFSLFLVLWKIFGSNKIE